MMKPIRGITKQLLGVWFIMATLSIAACNPKPPEVQPVSLTFADPTQPMVALMYIAEAKGYFAEEKLSITSIPVTSGRDSLKKLLAGEVELGAATEFPFANNLLAGRDLRILTTLYRSNTYSGVVARKDRGINSVKDLQGKTVGVAPNTNTDYMLSVMLNEVGLSDESIKRQAFKPEEMAVALKQGVVDAVATWSPHLAKAKSSFAEGDAVVLHTPLYAEMSILGTRPDIVQNKSDALMRLARALVKAEFYANQHSEEALVIVIEHIGLLNDKAKESLRRAWPGYTHQAKLDNLMLSAIGQEAAWLSKRDPTHPPVPDVLAYIDTAPLQTANAMSVTLAPK